MMKMKWSDHMSEVVSLSSSDLGGITWPSVPEFVQTIHQQIPSVFIEHPRNPQKNHQNNQSFHHFSRTFPENPQKNVQKTPTESSHGKQPLPMAGDSALGALWDPGGQRSAREGQQLGSMGGRDGDGLRCLFALKYFKG